MAPPDDGKMVIETLLRIERNLGGIDERLRGIEVSQAGMAVKLSEHMEDDQNRLGSLERSRAQLRGMVAMAAGAAGVLGSIGAWFIDRWTRGH